MRKRVYDLAIVITMPIFLILVGLTSYLFFR